MLKKKFTRIIAFFLSCALVAVFTFSFLSAFIDYQKKLNSHLQENYAVSDDMNDIYFKLWAVGNMYLRNLDDNGNFTGTDDLEKQTVSALQELGCMDSEAQIMCISSATEIINSLTKIWIIRILPAITNSQD